MPRVRFASRKKKKDKFPFLSLFSPQRLISGAEPDYYLLFTVLGLIVLGWTMVYSASAMFAEVRYHDQFFFLKKQVLWTFIGAGFFLLALNTPTSFWQERAKLFYWGTVGLLVLVLFMGPEIAGAKRWFRFGFFNLQPSELAKVTLVFMVADYLDRRQSRLTDFKRGLGPLLLLTGGVLFLIFIEPDLGTPVLMGGVFLALLVLGGVRLKHLLFMGIMTIPLLVFAIFQFRYRLERFFAYLNPWSDPHGSGYQLVQSLLAMGSGGFFGKGLGSSQIKIAHLPDAHTDFVFSVLGEELGLLGTLFCAGLFFFILIRGLRIARKAPTCFSSLLAAGLSLIIGFQALINMSVASGFLPTKGMPLPFISFGGSSLVITLFSIGILTHISKQGNSPLSKGGK